MENKIDLHIHTKYSNGKDDLITVLRQAEENGVKVLSITDYNSLKAYIELKNDIDVKKYYSGKIVVGLEVRCRFTGENGETRCCDMLGYNIDIDKIEEFQGWLNENTGKDQMLVGQVEQLIHYKKVARNLGIKFDEDLSLTPDEPKAGMTIINNILKYYAENVKVWPELSRYKEAPTSAWQEVFSNPKSEFFFDISQFCPELVTFLEKVHEYGGKVFAAHPLAYVTSTEKSEEETKADLKNYIERCLELDVDGIEGYNQYNCSLVPHAINANRFLLQYCKDRGIKISGGTDYHQKDIRHAGIGNLGSNSVQNCSEYIPEEIAMEWINPIEIERMGSNAR